MHHPQSSPLLTPLEHKCLSLLLLGDDPVLDALRSQLHSITNIERRDTGAGSYTEFHLAPGAPRLKVRPSFAFGDVVVECPNSAELADCIVFVKDGAIACLEIAALGDSWPANLADANVRYWSNGPRDINNLHIVPGWPVD